ncbi:MFS transporter [Myxococcota bacterium]|nr:MFS transporter [Myxococcota bacterium]
MRRELPAAAVAVAVAVLLVAAIYFGSRGLRDFDSALVGYAVATVFAAAALAGRYTRWISRPPTWRYFRAGWTRFLSFRNFRRYATLVPTALWRDIFAQTFIMRRGATRWVTHALIFWGVVVSLLITLPLTFGWIRFTLVPPATYQLWLVGLPILRFPVEAGTGFAVFHALNVTAALLIVGVAMALWRRLLDVGNLTTQRFGFDLLPLVLLFAIAVTGMALTASTLWWEGRFYWFVSLTHQVAVVAWLLSIPFGKFFHIVQRPASVGVTLYQQVGQGIEGEGASPQPMPCRRCGRSLPSAQFVRDLKDTLRDLHQDYDMGGGASLQDLCPSCKRVVRGQAYYGLLGKRFV